MTMSSSYQFQLPQDNQKVVTEAQNAAHEDVQDIYPDISREQWEIDSHARAVAEGATDHTPNLANDRQAYIDQYANAYTQSYQDEVQQRDAQGTGPQNPA